MISTSTVDTDVAPPHRNSETKTNEGKRVHWSQVKPLSANATSGNGRVPVNLGDGDDTVYIFIFNYNYSMMKKKNMHLL